MTDMTTTSGKGSGGGRIYVIHENDAWVEPLRESFFALGLPYEEWFLDGVCLVSNRSRRWGFSTTE